MPDDVEFVVWRGLADVPAYNEDVDVVPAPRPVAALRVEIERADAVLIATPEYNASVPGALKNALDWASRPYAANVLRHKRVAVIGASTGSVRRRLGPGRAAQGAENDGRLGPRGRAVGPGRTCPRSPSKGDFASQSWRSPFDESSTSSSSETVERAA